MYRLLWIHYDILYPSSCRSVHTLATHLNSIILSRFKQYICVTKCSLNILSSSITSYIFFFKRLTSKISFSNINEFYHCISAKLLYCFICIATTYCVTYQYIFQCIYLSHITTNELQIYNIPISQFCQQIDGRQIYWYILLS